MDANAIPDEIRASIFEVDYPGLSKMGFEAVYYDLDNTLLRRDEDNVSHEVYSLVKSLRYKFYVNIISNTIIQSKVARAREIGRILGVDAICCDFSRRKPKAWGYRQAQRLTGVEFSLSVMVGDQFFTDLIGAKRLGMYTIYVPPLGPDIWFSIFTFRRWREARILRRLANR